MRVNVVDGDDLATRVVEVVAEKRSTYAAKAVDSNSEHGSRWCVPFTFP